MKAEKSFILQNDTGTINFNLPLLTIVTQIDEVLTSLKGKAILRRFFILP